MAYTTAEVSELLDLPPWRIRRWARQGFLEPERGPGREYRFSFQDLVLLRTAAALRDSPVPQRRVHAALRELRKTLPRGRPLTAVRIVAVGDEIVAREGGTAWSPESGQVHLDFRVDELAERAAPLARRRGASAGAGPAPTDAEGWVSLARELEPTAPEEAIRAYERALKVAPEHPAAHAGLGYLRQERGELREAERHYRRVLAADPAHATAAFNLGVALEDRGRVDEAARAYRRALQADPGLADAHYNLAGLLEREGDRAGAIRHLKSYREATGRPGGGPRPEGGPRSGPGGSRPTGRAGADRTGDEAPG